MTEKTLPSNESAERAVLGAILLENSCFDQAAAKISAEDFAYDSHRKIFLSMEELWNATIPINFETLCDQLAKHRQLVEVGGVVFVTSLTDLLPRVKHIDGYLKIVEEKAMLRALIHTCNTTMNACYEAEDTPQRIASYHDDSLQKIISGRDSNGQHVADFSEDTFTQIANLRAKGAGLVGFSYGVEEVDRMTTGIRPKEFTIIGGRPKQGKTALALQSIEANCSNGIAEGFFSIEMNKEAILERLWSSVGKIPADHISEPHLLTDDELVRLHNAKETVNSWPLYIDDSADVTLNQVCARARLWKKRYNVQHVTLDYLQLFSGFGDIRMRMIKASRGLRLLAKEQGLAVTALSQLARPNDKNMNRRPEIWDLKESGSLEADANTILLIFRPVGDNGEFSGLDEIGITQRRGSPGIAPVTYLGKFVRFESRWLRGYGS